MRGFIQRLEWFLVCCILFGLAAISFLNMVIRNLSSFQFGQSGNDVAGNESPAIMNLGLEFVDQSMQWVPHLILAVGMLGASIGISRGEVIDIQVINRLYSAFWKKLTRRVCYSILFAVLLSFGYLSVKTWMVVADVWIWIVYFPGFILLALKSILVVIHPLQNDFTEKIPLSDSLDNIHPL